MSEEGSGRERQILHIDMNAFYCSCHASVEPTKYLNKATAVAGNPETRHGILVTASYEARRRGVRATMTVLEAKRICPELILIAPDFHLYRQFSARVFDLVQQYTPDLEVFSIDECWADVTGSRYFGSAREIAQIIQKRILEELGLPCSIGIGPNKFLAKMASDFKKPLGITEIQLKDVPEKLWPLPVGQMFGIGQSSAARLERLRIRTVGDLAHVDPSKLAGIFGKRAAAIHHRANGLDDSPVATEREQAKSIGHSITLAQDTSDLEELSTVLLNLSDQVGRRVRRHALSGKTIQLTIRYTSRKTITRSKTLSHPTDLTEDIYHTARALLIQHKLQEQGVRLLGVSLSQLTSEDETKAVPAGEQLHLFTDLNLLSGEDTKPAANEAKLLVNDSKKAGKMRKLATVTDQLRDKYGEDIVLRARMLHGHESNQLRDGKSRGTSLQKDNLH